MDYLLHYGIKGQRWGVRRTSEQLGHPGKIRTKESSRLKRRKKARKKRIRRAVRRVVGTSIVTAAALYMTRRSSVDRYVNSLASYGISSLARNSGRVRRGRGLLNDINRVDPMLDFRQTL